MNKKLKTISLDAMIDKHIGKIGTLKRDAFENELRLDLIGEAIKKAISCRIYRLLVPAQDCRKIHYTDKRFAWYGAPLPNAFSCSFARGFSASSP